MAAGTEAGVGATVCTEAGVGATVCSETRAGVAVGTETRAGVAAGTEAGVGVAVGTETTEAGAGVAVGTEAGVGVDVGLEQANNTTKTRNTDSDPNFGIARLSLTWAERRFGAWVWRWEWARQYICRRARTTTSACLPDLGSTARCSWSALARKHGDHGQNHLEH